MRSEIARRAEGIALSVAAPGTRQHSQPSKGLSLEETGSLCYNSAARDGSKLLKSRNPKGLHAVVNGVLRSWTFSRKGLTVWKESFRLSMRTLLSSELAKRLFTRIG